MNYQDDLKIDKNDLIEEWLKQSSLYMQYAEAYNDAIDDERRLKEESEIVKAKVDFEIRSSEPTDYGLNKFTESSISGIVQVDDRVLQAISLYNDAKKRTGLLQAAKDAMQDRKKALEYLSQFWLAGFFSTPKLKEMEGVVEEKNRIRVRKKLNNGYN